MEALKIYNSERQQECRECRGTIKPNQRFVYRKRFITVQGDRIQDIAPCCLPCAKEKGWI